jgi:hypothetical protein
MLYFAGDINFSDGFFDTGFGIGNSILNGKDPYCNINRDTNDIWFGNLECVVSDQSNKTGIYKKQFRIDTSCLKHIQHFNIYNVANNHVMQHGEEAFAEMLHCIESFGSIYIGANHRRTLEVQHQGKHIGLLSFSQREEKYSKTPLYWCNPEYTEIESEFAKIAHLDYKIVYIHWGNEFIDRPYLDQKKFAHWLVDLGFDLVVGAHPHVLQGYEIYHDKYIFYSLGNFVFNMPLESTRYSIVLKMDLSSNLLNIEFDYVHIEKDNFPKIIPLIDVPNQYRFEYLNERIKIENENELYYASTSSFNKKYRLSNYKMLIKTLFKFKFSVLTAIVFDFVKRRFSFYHMSPSNYVPPNHL